MYMKAKLIRDTTWPGFSVGYIVFSFLLFVNGTTI